MDYETLRGRFCLYSNCMVVTSCSVAQGPLGGVLIKCWLLPGIRLLNMSVKRNDVIYNNELNMSLPQLSGGLPTFDDIFIYTYLEDFFLCVLIFKVISDP